MSISRKKIAFFETTLLDFFQKVGREHLPWRRKRITAYEVWVSEIMLQQTQVSRVIEYYNRFLQRYPTIEILARSSWEEFLPYYEGLGYYARGRNMLKAAKMIVSEYDGKFPREKKLLEKIPGIGPYTASAILSFAYDENHLAWDTNLNRVVGRFFFGDKYVDFDREKIEQKFRSSAKRLNAALMDFGSALCLSRPKCEACPLQIRCVYYAKDGESEARAIVFLHENHRNYFSSREKKYEPFVLPRGYTSRAEIKDWFQETYNLKVSVRPPHQKLILKNRPTLLIHAQILSGKNNFSEFSQKEHEAYANRLIK